MNIAGKKFNRLTAVSRSHSNKLKWLFRCECGNEKEINRYNVTKGLVVSCGCYAKEIAKMPRPQRQTHGESGDCAEYRVWNGIKNRCYNKNDHKNYSRYGERGILMCAEWRDSYEAFLRDMGRRPSPDHSIERIDNDGLYEASNCRWATNMEQANNRRSSHVIECFGKKQTLSEWSRRTGIGVHTIRARIYRYGWSTEKALTQSVQGVGLAL